MSKQFVPDESVPEATAPGAVGLNVAVLRGVLSREPESRLLPSGTSVVAYDVTVARSDGPADSVPVVWSDPPDRRANVHAGDLVVVVGRVRRRFFRAGGVTQSRTEIVAERVLPARPAGRARSALERVIAALGRAVESDRR